MATARWICSDTDILMISAPEVHGSSGTPSDDPITPHRIADRIGIPNSIPSNYAFGKRSKKSSIYKHHSDYPGTSSSKDAHGRLFSCLKSSKYRSFSTTWLRRVFLSSSRQDIPNGVPASPTVSSRRRGREGAAIRLSLCN